MYANLRVTIMGDPEPIEAWRVEITPESVIVHLDDPDHGGSRAVPAGIRVLERDTRVSVGPSF